MYRIRRHLCPLIVVIGSRCTFISRFAFVLFNLLIYFYSFTSTHNVIPIYYCEFKMILGMGWKVCAFACVRSLNRDRFNARQLQLVSLVNSLWLTVSYYREPHRPVYASSFIFKVFAPERCAQCLYMYADSEKKVINTQRYYTRDTFVFPNAGRQDDNFFIIGCMRVYVCVRPSIGYCFFLFCKWEEYQRRCTETPIKRCINVCAHLCVTGELEYKNLRFKEPHLRVQSIYFIIYILYTVHLMLQSIFEDFSLGYFV